MTVAEFRGRGLTDAQLEQIRALATSLDSRQLMWVSGFLGGFEQACAPGTRAPLPAVDSDAGIPAARALTVLYGSETGNSAALATMLAERAAQRGLASSLCDMATYKTRHLRDEQDLLVITSTYGEGDPPQPAADFFEFLEGRKAPSWLEEGACVYVCGDANRLAPDVHQALATIVASEGGLGAVKARDYLQRLQHDRRYQRDVY